jgi:hypothetical protein
MKKGVKLLKITLDTNILRTLIDQDTSRCNIDCLVELFKTNQSIITYGTLFEVFMQHPDDDTRQRVINFLNTYKIEVAMNSELDNTLFLNLLYSQKDLSFLE